MCPTESSLDGRNAHGSPAQFARKPISLLRLRTFASSGDNGIKYTRELRTHLPPLKFLYNREGENQNRDKVQSKVGACGALVPRGKKKGSLRLLVHRALAKSSTGFASIGALRLSFIRYTVLGLLLPLSMLTLHETIYALFEPLPDGVVMPVFSRRLTRMGTRGDRQSII